MSETEKAYYVERSARTVTTMLVFAGSGAEARRLVQEGDGEAIDSVTTGVGYRPAKRVPAEDRS